MVELAEKPLLRTAPAPLLELSGAVQDARLKVVLTGEGADELFGGYDIFREDKVRRFWARDPSRKLRPLLFGRLNRYLADRPGPGGAFLRAVLRAGPRRRPTTRSTATGSAFANTARCLRLLEPGRRSGAPPATADPARPSEPPLPRAFGGFYAALRGRSTSRSRRSSRATCSTRRATGC